MICLHIGNAPHVIAEEQAFTLNQINPQYTQVMFNSYLLELINMLSI